MCCCLSGVRLRVLARSDNKAESVGRGKAERTHLALAVLFGRGREPQRLRQQIAAGVL